ncbi:unnamed protein product [Cochlearia groenlandica]
MCIGMLYRFLLADIEDRKFAEACIGQPYRFGVADTREKDPKHLYRHVVSAWPGRYEENEVEARLPTSTYRPACIGFT